MESKGQNKISGGSFLTWGGDSVPLINVFYDFTNACNLFCHHCFVDAKYPDDNELNTKESINLMDDIALLSPSRLTITGGEPLMRKDFLIVAQHASLLRNQGIGYLKLTTNGTLLTEKLASQIVLLFDQVNISIDGFQENHDDVRGVGSFKKAINGLRLLSNAGGEPKVSITITGKNYKEIPELIRYLNENENITRFNLRPLWNYGRASTNKELWITPELIDSLTSKLGLRKQDDEVLLPNGCNINICLAGYTISVNANGDIYPCVFMRTQNNLICNARDHKIGDLYVNSPSYIELRRKRPKGCLLVTSLSAS